MSATSLVWRERPGARLYLVAGILFLTGVLWSFARSYFLRALFMATPLPVPLRLHGMVMTGWVLLLVVQSGLVAIHRIRWHRLLGFGGAGWAVLVVASGSIATVHAAAREVAGHTLDARSQVTILGLELTQMVLFAAFVGTAVLLRGRTDVHKRLMLLTIPCMVPSVIARLPISLGRNMLILLYTDLFVLACVGVDTFREGRLHPAFAWGGGSFLLALQIAFFAFQTNAWIHLGTRLVS